MIRQFKTSLNSYTDRSSRSVEKYFHDISKIPLLSIDEEIELGTMIKQGGLGQKIAREKLVKSNLRFVVTVAKSYHRQTNGKLPLSDLIQAGNEGLIVAADKFDPAKGFRFLSFAIWWIRQSILLSMAKYSRVVRIPMNKLSDVSESAFSVSLEEPVSADSRLRLHEIIANENSPIPDENLVAESLQKYLADILHNMSPRDARILSMYFGFEGKEYTLEEIGKELNMSAERCRQIKNRILHSLKSSDKIDILRNYL